MLPESNEFAKSLWSQVFPEKENALQKTYYEFRLIRIPSAQSLILFCLNGFQWYRRQSHSRATIDFLGIFNNILRADCLQSRMGRMALAVELELLISLDENWVKSQFIPLLVPDRESEKSRSLWYGVLGNIESSLSYKTCMILREPLEGIVPHMNRIFENDYPSECMNLCRYMAKMFPEEAGKWLSLIEQYGSEQDQRFVALIP